MLAVAQGIVNSHPTQGNFRVNFRKNKREIFSHRADRIPTEQTRPRENTYNSIH